jgi:hypothetical protein
MEITRKHAVPIFEFFDGCKVTLRSETRLRRDRVVVTYRRGERVNTEDRPNLRLLPAVERVLTHRMPRRCAASTDEPSTTWIRDALSASARRPVDALPTDAVAVEALVVQR